MKKNLSSIYLRYSIWLTAITVIVLIILLALTVYYVRERSIIELFSAQQASIAYQTASRIDESIAKCEKGMTVLSRMVAAQGGDQDKNRQEIKLLYDELKDTVLAIVQIDKNDVVINGYPEDISSKMYGKNLEDSVLDHAMKKLHQRYVGEITDFKEIERNPKTSSIKKIGVGLPLLATDGTYNGALVAVLSPQLIIKRFIPL
ncbi:MAG TPA: hypothetical protein VMU10_10505, partial [Desulfomonilia bacterium]|nr:hypothetical protein [Desulfomonilia bacterium]